MASEERFGYEWGKYNAMDLNYEIQFAGWVAPLKREDFWKKRVLDAGCGMGRNSFWAIRWGARDVTAFDFDPRSVESAQKTLSGFGNATVAFKSIYEITWDAEFDLAFSIGVIHHLYEPLRAVRNLARSVRSGGIVLLWVYSKEGTGWFLWALNPMRKYITSRMPLDVVHIFTYLFSVPLWILIKLLNGPTEYLRQLSRFSFSHVHSIIFGQLIPEVANYWTESEANALLSPEDFSEIHVFRSESGMGWTVVGIRK